MDIEKLPEELQEKRKMIECEFVLSLYKDMALLDEYKNVVNGEDILTEDGMFYYALIQKMRQAGYNVADNISICEFIEDKKTLKKKFEKTGGFQTIKDITELLDTNNIDAYYDGLAKSNLILRLYDKGFNVKKYLDKFEDMTAEEVYDFMEYQLADIAVGKIEKTSIADLSAGYEEYIKEWDEGRDVGFRISLSMLNYQLLGVHKKNLLLHLAGIGIGKTTSAISWYVLPAIEDGNNCVIIANEQDQSQWRQMILSTVIFNKLNKKAAGLDRHKMLKGSFTDDQKAIMKEASEWLKQQPGKIAFVETQDYDATAIKKIIARQSKLGYSYFLFDTAKPIDDSDTKSWGQFSEVAKSLFLCAKKYDVAIIATMQLSSESMGKKFLDLSCIGKSKAVAETAGSVVMFRPLQKTEKEKIEAYKWNEDNKKIKEMIQLDPNKEYIMIFTPKNRYGNVSPQIIVERNMAFNSYRQVGWYECEYDGWKTK